MAERVLGMKDFFSWLQEIAALTVVGLVIYALFAGADAIEAAVLAVRAGL
jgi:hypothetical protein